MKKCNAGHKMKLNIKINDGNEDTGWHCGICNEYWALDSHEQRIFDVGYKQAVYDNRKKIKAYKSLIASLKTCLGFDND